MSHGNNSLGNRMEVQQHAESCSQRPKSAACHSSPIGTDLVASGVIHGQTRVVSTTIPTYVERLRYFGFEIILKSYKQ